MKVTVVSYHAIMMRCGGPRTHLLQTKKELEKRGIEIEFFDIWKPRSEIFNTDLFHLHGSTIGLWDLATYLHAHKTKYVVRPVFFTRRSAGVVRTVCALNSFVDRLARGIWSGYSITRDICNWAQRVLPNTSEEANLIREGLKVPEENITVIPNGVERRFAEADPDLFIKEYGVRDFILNVGHIGPDRKNVLSLIRALSTIDHPAVIIGRVFPSREADLCLEEAQRNNNLILIPGLNHDSQMLASAYAACDVFALPAKYETPGIAALEAGLAGAKIVITPHGGTKDYFADMAIYVDPYSVDAIRTGIVQALERTKNDLLKKHIGENFLWKKVAEKTAEVYRAVLQE